MSEVIVLDKSHSWSASSEVFSPVLDYLEQYVVDVDTVVEVRLINEQNFRRLDLSKLSAVGRSQIFEVLKSGFLVDYVNKLIASGSADEIVLGVTSELVGLARNVRE
jgi:hypothetical protein